MKQINHKLKMALELGPVLVFFLAYILLKDKAFNIAGTEYKGFVLATIGFVPILVICTAILWRLTGKLAPMQIVTLVLVVVFGGLTIWFNDGDFLKMKVTIIYALFAAILGFGLLRGRSYLAFVMSDVIPLEPRGWLILTQRITAFFLALAVANEVLWRNFPEQTWVYFKTFGLPVAVFAFFIAQSGLLSRYAIPDKKDDE